MSSDFQNIKDDPKRLEEHTQFALEELADFTRRCSAGQIDARAIYIALRVFQSYYYELGKMTLGPKYILKMEEQAHKLAQGMFARDL